MPYVTTAGAKVHYTDSGGAGLPVVLGHGFWLDHSMFDQQTAALAPRYRVISIDARGHGLTEDEGDAFSYWDLARDTWSVLDAIGVDKAVVGGMSQGGFTALRMALLSPSRVSGLVLIGTTADAYTPKQKIGYRQVMDAWMGTGPLDVIAKPMAAVMIGGTAQDQQRWLDKWHAEDRMRIRGAAECLINRESITELVADITCPAVLVRGVSDQAFSHDEMTALASQLGGEAHLHTIAGATHGVNMTDPDAVNAIVLDFLGGMSQP